MSIKDKYYIQEIDYHTAENIVVKCHYAHRKASCIHAFGLFSKEPNRIVGVVIYGIPVSKDLCNALCGVEERNNIYELTRLYVDDGLEKNLESYLVGNTLKMLDKEIIVSYSDLGYGHVGVIYQATNFYFTGVTGADIKDYVEVDENGNKLSETKSNYKEEQWVYDYKYEYTYDENGNQLKKEYFTWSNYSDDWNKPEIYEYTYDENNRILCETKYKRYFGWVIDYKYEYLYDDNGIKYTKIDGEWVLQK